MMYVPFCLITLTQRLDRSRISSQNVFFREKSLKVNFDGIRIWEIFFHQENFEESGKDDNSME